MAYNPIMISRENLIAKNVNSYNDINNFKTGDYYWYYTRKETVGKILGNENNKGQFFVSNIEKMNDPNERKRHAQEANRVYALCFSNYKDESIPMWYLYGGITGEGVRIGFTADKMHKLVDGINVVHAVGKDNKPRKRKYLKGKDYNLQCGWVFYWSRNDRIRYRDKYYSIGDMPKGFSKQQQRVFQAEEMLKFSHNNYFVKDYAWHYEKEFRIIFIFKESVGERIELCFDKKSLVNGMRVTLAPNVLSEDDFEQNKKIEDYAKLFNMPVSKVSPSDVSAKLDLLNRNEKVIKNHMAFNVS